MLSHIADIAWLGARDSLPHCSPFPSGRLSAGQMMPADMEAIAATEDSNAARPVSTSVNSLDKGLPGTAFDVALKAVIVSKKVRLLREPDVNSTPGGHISRGEQDVDQRIVASNGRVYFRLKDHTGWVCTTSRRDADSIVVSVGPVALGGKTLVTLLKDCSEAGFMPKSITVEGYPEVVALADALKQVMTEDDEALLWARVWGVLRGIRGEAGVRWAAKVLTGDATLKDRLLEDLPAFATQFAALHRTARATLPSGGAHAEGRHHIGSGPAWVDAFNTDGGVRAFERATSSMAEFLKKRSSLHSDDIVGMMNALEGVFPFSIRKVRGGKSILTHYGQYNSLDASRGLLLILQHNGHCKPTPISQFAYQKVQKRMADGGVFLRRLQLQNVSDLSSLGGGGDGVDAASRWMTILALTCEFNQLLASRSRFLSQGECGAVLELLALLAFPRMTHPEETVGHGHAHGECFAVRHLRAALQKAKLTDTRATAVLTDSASVQPVQIEGVRKFAASVAMARVRHVGPARTTPEEAEPDIGIVEALATAGPAAQVLLKRWADGSVDSSTVQCALETIPPLQAERAAAALAVKAVKRKIAENTVDPAPTASKRSRMSTGSCTSAESTRASGELKLPWGHLKNVEMADPALRSAFKKASRRLDSMRHTEDARYREVLAERASVYAKIDPEYAVPSALQALTSTLEGKFDKFSASIGNLCASLQRDVLDAVDATTETVAGTDAEKVVESVDSTTEAIEGTDGEN